MSETEAADERDAAAAAGDTRLPLVARHADLRHRLLIGAARLGLRASLLVSPRPAALLLRRLFAAGGAATARGLAPHAPAGGVALVRDERYGDGPDALLDLYRPAAASGPLPTVVWFHGGGWIGGAKEELADWHRIVAAHGFAVAAPRYPLAPERRYPEPLRHAMRALAHLRAEAPRLGLDGERFALAGDSAGAQIAAQAAALVTTPGYAATVGVAPTLAPAQLRATVLACGPYDLGLLDGAAGDARRIATALLRTYSGRRRFLRDPRFAAASVAGHLSAAFPPALVTVGDADPLRAHSELLARRLAALGVETETVFFPDGHRPPLGHEYQFDLDGDAGRQFLERMLAFLDRRLAA